MANQQNDKKSILIATRSIEKNTLFESIATKRVFVKNIQLAIDVKSVLAKLKELPPQVLVTELQLDDGKGSQLVDLVLKEDSLKSTAVIITDQLPETEKFLDELVSGRIQFLSDDQDEEQFTHCLVRAMNYASHTEKADFYLRYLAKGDQLIVEGEKADFIYIVKKGMLRAYRINEQSSPVTLGNIEVGEFCGEMAYINGVPRTANVEAITDCELIEVPIGTFEKVLYQRPAWSKALMATLSKRLRQANDFKSSKN